MCHYKLANCGFSVLCPLQFFLKRFIAWKVYIACTRTSYRIVPLTNLNKYLHYDASTIEVNLNISANNGSEKL